MSSRACNFLEEPMEAELSLFAPLKPHCHPSILTSMQAHQSTLDLLDVITSGQLTTSTDTDMYRKFFDLKTEHWKAFRDNLETIVVLHSSWDEVRGHGTLPELERGACAERFLQKYGEMYWGSEENRVRYLIEENVQHSDTCIFPLNQAALHVAIKLLIEKSAEWNHDSNTSSAGTSQSSSFADVSGLITPRLSDLFTPVLNHITASVTQEFASYSESAGPHHSNDASVAAVSRGRPRCRSNNPWKAKQAQSDWKINFRTQMMATYLLVTDEVSTGGPAEPVCVPFKPFFSSGAFIEYLTEECSRIDWLSSDSENDNPENRQRYAVVNLPWSATKTPFVVRPDSGDLAALILRLDGAWTAQEQGKLDLFEFEVLVTLKAL